MTTPLLGLAVYRSKRNIAPGIAASRKADGTVASLATESLGAIGMVQAFTLERHQSGHFEELSGDSLSAGVEAVRLQARFGPMVDAAGLVSVLIVLWVGAEQSCNGQMKLGVLLIFLTYVGSLYKPVKALSKLTMIFTKGMAAAERINDVLSTEPDIDDRPTPSSLRHSRVTSASTRSRSRMAVNRCCGRCRSRSTPARPLRWSGLPGQASRHWPRSSRG